jgi:hypothetical protein
MVTHIAHATATFAELTLAMSIALLTKIISSPVVVDSLARETTEKRIETNENRFVKATFKFACTITDKFNGFMLYAPIIAFVLAIAALCGLALCSLEIDRVQYEFFCASLFSFILISLKVYLSREMLQKTGEAPAVEPVD